MYKHLLIVGAVFLVSCQAQEGPSNLLQSYLTRISAVTGIEETTKNLLQREWLDIPHLKKTRAIINKQRINMLEFLSLSGCSLQGNIGQRNSQLGHMAVPSQLFILDLDFIHLAPACIEALKKRGNQELASQLEQMASTRQKTLPLKFYEATLMGPEWRQFWTPSEHLKTYPDQTNSQIADAIAKLSEIFDGSLASSWRNTSKDFEATLSKIRYGDGGDLIAASHLYLEYLQRINAILEKAKEDKPFCPYGLPTERSRTLQRIVERFFIKGVQPWLVTIRQRRDLLMGPVRQLEQKLADITPKIYTQWADSRDLQLAGITTKTREHINLIQTMLSPCNSGAALGREQLEGLHKVN